MDGLVLMAVGMITVILALGLVAGLGHLLILAVNRYAPPTPLPVYPDEEAGMRSPAEGAGNDPAKLAAVLAAVEVVTRGKGTIVNIVKSEG
jgi:oxaloacetate decarboxylase gamma subunit